MQGIYCFTGDLATAMTSGNAIDIQTNNVMLDLNGFKLSGLGAGLNTFANGIYALSRQNITIKNGTVRGFFRGILLEGSPSQGHVVEDIRADQNTYTGIGVSGSGVIIRNNQVVATAGNLIADLNVYGIIVSGVGARVLNNDVINTAVTPLSLGCACAIYLDGGSGILVVNNRITVAAIGIDYTDSGSTGKYRDNLTFAVTTPFWGGTNAGNNN